MAEGSNQHQQFTSEVLNSFDKIKYAMWKPMKSLYAYVSTIQMLIFKLITKVESRPLNPPQGDFRKSPCGGFKGLLFGCIAFQRTIPIIYCFFIFTLPLESTAQSTSKLTIARLKYNGGGDWYANPSSLPNLIKAVKKATSIPVNDTFATVEIMDENFFHYPFIYLTGHGDIHFTNQEKIRLRRYLIGGGFLWADDNYGLDKSFRKEIAALFPENALTEIPSDHPIYSSVYKLPGLPKIHVHDGKPAQGFGVFFEKRLVLFYSYSSDIGDGMEDLQVHNDGPELHEIALRMGINVIAWFYNP